MFKCTICFIFSRTLVWFQTRRLCKTLLPFCRLLQVLPSASTNLRFGIMSDALALTNVLMCQAWNTFSRNHTHCSESFFSLNAVRNYTKYISVLISVWLRQVMTWQCSPYQIVRQVLFRVRSRLLRVHTRQAQLHQYQILKPPPRLHLVVNQAHLSLSKCFHVFCARPSSTRHSQLLH